MFVLLPQEWGDDHEADTVMHLRTPILSAAIAMGVGGITTVHQVALSSLHLDGEVGCPLFLSSLRFSFFLSCVTRPQCSSQMPESFLRHVERDVRTLV